MSRAESTRDIPIPSESDLVNKSGMPAPKHTSLVPESMFWKMSLHLEMRQFFLLTMDRWSETSPWVTKDKKQPAKL